MSTLANIGSIFGGHSWSSFGQPWPGSAKLRPDSTEFGRNWAGARLAQQTFGNVWATFGATFVRLRSSPCSPRVAFRDVCVCVCRANVRQLSSSWLSLPKSDLSGDAVIIIFGRDHLAEAARAADRLRLWAWQRFIRRPPRRAAGGWSGPPEHVSCFTRTFRGAPLISQGVGGGREVSFEPCAWTSLEVAGA